MTLEEVIEKQKSILNTISKIPICNAGARVCKECEHCLQIRELGLEYEKLTLHRRKIRNRNTKADKRLRDIKAKGKKADQRDIYFLLVDMKMTKGEAAAFIGVTRDTVGNRCRKWGYSHQFVKSRRVG